MANNNSSTLVSDAEITAALAEAQALSDEIPSLEDGHAPKVVHVPVEPPQMPLSAVPHPAAPDTAPPAPAAEPAGKPARGPWLGTALYRMFDIPLQAVNWPFRRLSPTARQIMGLLAIATIVTSVLALLLLPARSQTTG
jgi:hypothetical protein